jgi:RNA polymerase sigma factor (TIGR02999 family)
MAAASSESGNAASASPAPSNLFATLYGELHRLARAQLRSKGVFSISATTLLHDAYLSMHARDARSFPDGASFIAYAASAMRGIVIDHIRYRRAQKRGGEFHLSTLDTDAEENAVREEDVPRIGDALASLAQVEPDLAQLVDLKFFCGLSIGEIATLRNVSERTIFILSLRHVRRLRCIRFLCIDRDSQRIGIRFRSGSGVGLQPCSWTQRARPVWVHRYRSPDPRFTRRQGRRP